MKYAPIFSALSSAHGLLDIKSKWALALGFSLIDREGPGLKPIYFLSLYQRAEARCSHPNYSIPMRLDAANRLMIVKVEYYILYVIFGRVRKEDEADGKML
ncbi:MAG: hypothetical protein JF584_11365 [Acidobacteria bacterium]|nr:hypothetical protein [Acidobacteriota bacterium]